MPGKNKTVGRCGMALHLMTSPSRRLLLKGVLKCLTSRCIVRLSTWWEMRGGERAVILRCAAAASSLLHDIGHGERGRETGKLQMVEIACCMSLNTEVHVLL